MSVTEVICLTTAVVFTALALVSFIRGIARIISTVNVGAPLPGRTRPVGRRLWLVFSKVISHHDFRGRRTVRVAHWLVMVSFPLLFLTLISGYGQLLNPRFALPLIGHFLPWEWLVEAISWLSFAAILVLIGVRTRAGRGHAEEAADTTGRSRLHRFLGSSWAQARFVEGVILVVVCCVLLLRGLEYAVADDSWWHYPTTAWIGALALKHWSLAGVANAIPVVATIKIVVSMLWMTVVGLVVNMGVAWHRFIALVNIYARRELSGQKALGNLRPLYVGEKPLADADPTELVEARLGVGTTADLTWKTRLDLLSCTECGRCQELCPAWLSGKPLSPKLFNLALRDHAVASSAFVLGANVSPGQSEDEAVAAVKRYRSELLPHSADTLGALRAAQITGTDGVAISAGELVGNVISPETLWACTTCGACVEQCPADLEILDNVIDIRRHETLMKSAFPADLQVPLRNLERRANPFGIGGQKRLEWAAGLPFKVPVVGKEVTDASEVDYLFWVGCAGAFDDRAKKTTRAVAELLHAAAVKFAVLGSGESCTGDPARRAGNELLFQTLARGAIDRLQAAKAQKIVVTCAHCFNTIRNEYPDLGGNFTVIHHSELLAELVETGRLRPVDSEDDQAVTYHDPCYLGRHNGVYQPPRELLTQMGIRQLEMGRNRDRALCCGAGGGHAFMQDNSTTRIADLRVREAGETGAKTVATACPFCSTMLSSAAGAQHLEIKDIALILRERVQVETTAPEAEAPAESTVTAADEAKDATAAAPPAADEVETTQDTAEDWAEDTDDWDAFFEDDATRTETADETVAASSGKTSPEKSRNTNAGKKPTDNTGKNTESPENLDNAQSTAQIDIDIDSEDDWDSFFAD